MLRGSCRTYDPLGDTISAPRIGNLGGQTRPVPLSTCFYSTSFTTGSPTGPTFPGVPKGEPDGLRSPILAGRLEPDRNFLSGTKRLTSSLPCRKDILPGRLTGPTTLQSTLTSYSGTPLGPLLPPFLPSPVLTSNLPVPRPEDRDRLQSFNRPLLITD